MAISERELRRTEARMETQRQASHAADLAEGLSGASASVLAQIEISPAGLGLHWPRLDADLYVPSLLQGLLGSKSWMARQLGSAGGQARSKAKTAASRENGRKGGRPRKTG